MFACKNLIEQFITKNGMFGEVEDFFYRTEYQARRTGHTHTLLWIKDAPIISKSTEE